MDNVVRLHTSVQNSSLSYGKLFSLIETIFNKDAMDNIFQDTEYQVNEELAKHYNCDVYQSLMHSLCSRWGNLDSNRKIDVSYASKRFRYENIHRMEDLYKIEVFHMSTKSKFIAYVHQDDWDYYKSAINNTVSASKVILCVVANVDNLIKDLFTGQYAAVRILNGNALYYHTDMHYDGESIYPEIHSVFAYELFMYRYIAHVDPMLKEECKRLLKVLDSIGSDVDIVTVFTSCDNDVLYGNIRDAYIMLLNCC